MTELTPYERQKLRERGIRNPERALKNLPVDAAESVKENTVEHHVQKWDKSNPAIVNALTGPREQGTERIDVKALRRKREAESRVNQRTVPTGDPDPMHMRAFAAHPDIKDSGPPESERENIMATKGMYNS